MRAAAFSVAATVLLMGGVLVSANAISTHPARTAAAPSALDNAVTSLQPYVYWPLNTGSFPQADASGNGRPGLSVAGTGGAVRAVSSHPAGGSGGSVAFDPASRLNGRYLRSGTAPLGGGPGTLIVWFKLDRSLPPWMQTLVADNGAATKYGAALVVDQGGRVALGDSTYGNVYSNGSPPYGNNFCRRPGPHCAYTRTAPLNDGRWHMAAIVDQYRIGTATVTHDGWLPSLLYVDGQLVDSTIEGRWLDVLGASASRAMVGSAQHPQVSTVGRFSGDVASLALFTRLLSAAEIKSVWSAGS